MTPLPALPLAGLAVLCAMMLLLWVVGQRIRNAAVVDVGWGAALVILAGLYFAFGGGYAPRRTVVCAMVALWGARLFVYLLTTRIIGHEEEGRYRRLRAEWGDAAPRKLLRFFLMQAVAAVVLSVVFLIPATNTAPADGSPVAPLLPVELLGVLLWLTGFVGESLADHQLHRFRSDPANRGAVCRAGLWRVSRHPNYFFEWLMWVALAVFALGSPMGWIGIASPLIISFFLFRVTGIPATEEQALSTKGGAYREYQRTTSAFFPWFPKRGDR